jgi:hypothetical protein
MEVSPARIAGLQESLAGYQRTGVPLVGFDGSQFTAGGAPDDPGLYYFVPQVCERLHLPLHQGITAFLGAILAVSLLLGILSCLRLCKTAAGKALAVAGLVLLTAAAAVLWDVYVVSEAVVVCLVPSFCHLLRQPPAWKLSFFGFLAGVLVGTANFIRSHSGTGVLVFMAVGLIGLPWSRWKKISLIAACALGVLSARAFFDLQLDRRDAFLRARVPGYQLARREHGFWHSIYIGLGFLTNPYGLDYVDEVGIAKVRSIAPQATYLSDEYEAILRREYFRTIYEHPLFFLRTEFAKLGVVFMYLVAFANAGLVAAYRFPKPRSVELAYWSALSFEALFGLLVVPTPWYLLGFMAFAGVYGIVSVDEAISRHPRLRGA